MAKTQLKVKLLEEDGNAFFIMGRVVDALKKGGRKDLVESYRKEATNEDYNNLLRGSLRLV